MKSDRDSVELLKAKVADFPETLVILGSGWNKVVESAKIIEEIGYDELFGVSASVPGHEGKLIIGAIGSKMVAFMAGRFHLYEGYTAHEATTPVRVFAELGLKRVVITSASGGINQEYKVGDFVVLSDLITLFIPSNPLVGPKFQDMSTVFDPSLREAAIEICKIEKIPYREGVYMYVPGPHFETPADKRLAMGLGADCIGMSTVPESIQARNLGLQVLGLSFVTNLAFVKHDHEEVLAAAEEGSKQMVTLLSRLITEI